MNWKVQESPCAGRWEVRGDGVKVVAQLIGTKEQATLLAAAPELLAALRDCRDWLAAICDSNKLEATERGYLEAATNAINKADGRGE